MRATSKAIASAAASSGPSGKISAPCARPNTGARLKIAVAHSPATGPNSLVPSAYISQDDKAPSAMNGSRNSSRSSLPHSFAQAPTFTFGSTATFVPTNTPSPKAT